MNSSAVLDLGAGPSIAENRREGAQWTLSVVTLVWGCPCDFGLFEQVAPAQAAVGIEGSFHCEHFRDAYFAYPLPQSCALDLSYAVLGGRAPPHFDHDSGEVRINRSRQCKSRRIPR